MCLINSLSSWVSHKFSGKIFIYTTENLEDKILFEPFFPTRNILSYENTISLNQINHSCNLSPFSCLILILIDGKVNNLVLLAQAACVHHPRWSLQCVAIVITNFRYFSLFFFYVFCFWPTSGKLLRLKICFPQYFGITRRYIIFLF